MRRWIGSSLVQIKACRLFGVKPLHGPMLPYCQLNPWVQISLKFKAKFELYHFHSRKFIWKCRLPIWRPFCWGGWWGGGGFKLGWNISLAMRYRTAKSYPIGKNMEYSESTTKETLAFDIMICWKWLISAPTTNKYCDVNARVTCSVMEEKCNLQCSKLNIQECLFFIFHRKSPTTPLASIIIVCVLLNVQGQTSLSFNKHDLYKWSRFLTWCQKILHLESHLFAALF